MDFDRRSNDFATKPAFSYNRCIAHAFREDDEENEDRNLVVETSLSLFPSVNLLSSRLTNRATDHSPWTGPATHARKAFALLCSEEVFATNASFLFHSSNILQAEK